MLSTREAKHQIVSDFGSCDLRWPVPEKVLSMVLIFVDTQLPSQPPSATERAEPRRSACPVLKDMRN